MVPPNTGRAESMSPPSTVVRGSLGTSAYDGFRVCVLSLLYKKRKTWPGHEKRGLGEEEDRRQTPVISHKSSGR